MAEKLIINYEDYKLAVEKLALTIEKNYTPVKNHIKEIKTACLWKKKSSSFTPDFCPILLNGDPWIVQPSEYYDEIDINGLKKKHS